jgi:hypothetical protein
MLFFLLLLGFYYLYCCVRIYQKKNLDGVFVYDGLRKPWCIRYTDGLCFMYAIGL